MDRETAIRLVGRLLNAEGTEEQQDHMLQQLEAYMPNSRINDLIYWGERDRTAEEIVDESQLRSRLWTEEGDTALRAHIVAQLKVALEDPSTQESARFAAQSLLRDLGEIH